MADSCTLVASLIKAGPWLFGSVLRVVTPGNVITYPSLSFSGSSGNCFRRIILLALLLPDCLSRMLQAVKVKRCWRPLELFGQTEHDSWEMLGKLTFGNLQNPKPGFSQPKSAAAQALIESDEKRAVWWALRARHRLELGLAQEALEDTQEALWLEPRSPRRLLKMQGKGRKGTGEVGLPEIPNRKCMLHVYSMISTL